MTEPIVVTPEQIAMRDEWITRHLQGKCRLTNAGLSTNQYYRPPYQSTTQYPI